MDMIEEHLQSELKRVLERLQRTSAAVTSDPGAAVPWDEPEVEDEGDAGFANTDRETSFASRSLLLERARRLAKALERCKGGDYGVCEECGEAIRPARLRAMPEATTCVSCQERLEGVSSRTGRPAVSRPARRELALD
jgi:DnaK suppressor protein